MPDLSFHVQSAEAVRFAAAPLLVFKLRIDQPIAAVPIHAIALKCQIRIEPAHAAVTPLPNSGGYSTCSTLQIAGARH